MWYDLLTLVILMYAMFRGAMKGIVWQLATIAALLMCFFFSGSLSAAVAPFIRVEPPLNQWIAMFILYLGFSFVSFGVAKVVHEMIESMKIEALDRHLGAILGLVKGGMFSLFLTFFLVTLSHAARDTIISSESGYVAAVVIDRLDPVIPGDLHALLEPYIRRLDAPEIEREHREERIARQRQRADEGDPLDRRELADDDRDGADRDRLDADSGDRDGIDRDGIDRDGIDRGGRDRDPVDRGRANLDRAGRDRANLDRAGRDRALDRPDRDGALDRAARDGALDRADRDRVAQDPDHPDRVDPGRIDPGRIDPDRADRDRSRRTLVDDRKASDDRRSLDGDRDRDARPDRDRGPGADDRQDLALDRDGDPRPADVNRSDRRTGDDPFSPADANADRARRRRERRRAEERSHLRPASDTVDDAAQPTNEETDWLSSLPSLTDELKHLALKAWRRTRPEHRRDLTRRLSSTVPDLIRKTLQEWVDGPPAPAGAADGERADLERDIIRTLVDAEADRQAAIDDIETSIKGVPDDVAIKVLRDWQSDLRDRNPDRDPRETDRSSLNDRILRQLAKSKISLRSLDAATRERLRGSDTR